MAEDKKIKFNTKVIHVSQKPEPPYGAVSHPIYLTSTYEQKKFGEYDYDYSRAGNPTRENVEKTISSLEEGKRAIAFSSGMAAISTSLLSFLSSGDHVIFQPDLYGGTRNFATEHLNTYGIEYSFADSTNLNDFSSKIKDNTKVIYVESPSNPLMKIIDFFNVKRIPKLLSGR